MKGKEASRRCPSAVSSGPNGSGQKKGKKVKRLKGLTCWSFTIHYSLFTAYIFHDILFPLHINAAGWPYYQSVERHPSASLRSSFVIATYCKVRLIHLDFARLASGCFWPACEKTIFLQPAIFSVSWQRIPWTRGFWPPGQACRRSGGWLQLPWNESS